MSNHTTLAQNLKKPGALVVIVLNVGDGDAIIIRYPPKHDKESKKIVSVVDCYNAKKTIAALNKVKPDKIAFICATHPHYDHTRGLSELIKWCISQNIEIEEFWDSGFRHVSKTHYDLIQLLRDNPHIERAARLRAQAAELRDKGGAVCDWDEVERLLKKSYQSINRGLSR